MITEARQLRLRRLKEKHAEGLFLWELENGFELSLRESEVVLDTARGILVEGKTVERGKRYVAGVEVGERASGLRTSRQRGRCVVKGFPHDVSMGIASNVLPRFKPGVILRVDSTDMKEPKPVESGGMLSATAVTFVPPGVPVIV